MSKKIFPKGIKTGIAIRGITDRHTGKKSDVIICKSVWEVHRKLREYIGRGRMPSYEWVLRIVKSRGFIDLIKENINGSVIYKL